MNERDLRSMFHKAVGDTEAPGYLESQTRQALKRSLASRAPREIGGLMAMTAALLAFAVVAVLVAPRIASNLGQSHGTKLPVSCVDGTGPKPARVSAAMAYDAASNQVVLFGGAVPASTGSALDDTWVWNGTSWSQRILATRPPGRTQAAMAYDAATHKLVLFGGVDTDGTPYNDTCVKAGLKVPSSRRSQIPQLRTDFV